MGIFGKKHDVFISYKSQNVDLARLIADRLIHSGKSVWFNEYQVLLVERHLFQDAIDQGIRDSRFGIALTNDEYAKSEFCEKEIVQLLQYCGTKNILEIKIPMEPKTHQKYPKLSESPSHIFTGDVGQLFGFIAQITGWKIPSPVQVFRIQGESVFKGDCLGKEYSIDVSGWELVERSFHGGGPCYVKNVEGFDIFWNLQCGEELSPKAYEARLGLNKKNDRELYDQICVYAQHYFSMLKPGSKVAGVHLVFHEGISHFAVTYHDGMFWKRRYSIMLSHPITSRIAEFLFTFQFPGPYKQYFRYCELMDNLIRTLNWGDSASRAKQDISAEPERRPSQREEKTSRIIDDQPMANKYNSEGLMYAKQGRLKEAVRSWEKVLNYTTLADLRGMVLFNMGRAHEKMGEPARAIELYKQSAMTNPGQFNALSNIGSIYLRQNNPKEALPFLLEAANKNPHDHITINNLIFCYEKLGNFREAKSWRDVQKRR